MDILLLNSGGMDSLASALLANGHTLHSLHLQFNYPSSARSLIAAQLIADTYCIDHKVVNLTDLEPIGIEYGERFRPVPYQQLLVCSIGADVAQKKKIARVMTGVRKLEILNSIDFFGQYLEMALNQFRVSELTDLHYMFPLKDISLADKDVFYNIIKDSPILHDTVSCLNDPACGICYKCQFRQEYSI